MKELLASVIILLSLTSSAQDLPNPVPPSPTVANLMNLEATPVDHYTGQPNISIPVFSKQVNQALSLSGILQYSTQGVKIDSRSGWEGTGWSLNAGGVISRTVRGYPDENTALHELGVFHNNDFWNYDQLSNSQKSEHRWEVMGYSTTKADGQMDLYQYSYPGGSGRFVLKKDGSNLEPKIMTAGEKITITPYWSSTYELNSFKITDTKGLQYYFTQIEASNPTPFTASSTQKEGGVGLVYAPGSSFSARTAWHLTSIENESGQELASFSYQSSTESYTLSKTITENIITTDKDPAFYQNDCNNEILKPRKVASYLSVSASTAKLSSINFLDGTSVDFVANSSIIHPETNGKVLKEVIIKGNDQSSLKKYTLSHSISNSRLWLDKITETDLMTGEVNDYTMSYHDREILPEFDSPKDPWGFISPDIPRSNPNLPPDFDPEIIKTGLLTSITYPTGGRQQFTWENNTYSYGGGSALSSNQYMKNPDNYTQLIKNINFRGGSGTIYTGSIDIDYDQEIYIEVLSPNDPSVLEQVVLEVKNGGNSYINFQLNEDFGTGDVPAGTHTIEIKSLNLDEVISGTIKIYHYEQNTTISKFLYGGGPRVSDIKLMEGLDTKKHIQFDYTDPDDPSMSSGSVDGVLGSLHNEYSISTSKWLFNAGGPSCSSGGNNSGEFMSQTINYDVVSDGVRVQLSKGNYVGYKHIKVSEAGNGYTDYIYTTSNDYPNPNNVHDFPFFAPRYLDHKRGLLLNRSVYNEQNQLLLDEFYTYEMSETDLVYTFEIVDYESCPERQFYATHTEFLNSNPSNVPICLNGPCLYDPYQNCGGVTPANAISDTIKIGWSRKSEVLTREYSYYAQSNASYTESRQTYDYNSTNYQVSEVNQHINEAGTEVLYRTNNYYSVGTIPSNYNDQTSINALNNANKVNEVIYSERKKIKGSSASTISKTKNVYRTFNGIVGLSEVQTSKASNPLEKRMEIHGYDAYGNVQEVSKSNNSGDDVHIVYLWSYNNSRPVVQIQDATISDVPYAIRTGIGTANENVMSGYIDDLRTTYLPDKQIISYTYNEQLQVDKKTDPNGLSTTYEYDGMGRLLRIKDHHDNTLQEFEYNYGSN